MDEELKAMLEELKDGQDLILERLEEIANPGDDDEEPGPVDPAPGRKVIVVVERANARFIKSYKTNKKTGAKVPIMAIYPRDTAPTKERIQFTYGAQLRVDANPVQADGGGKYFRLQDMTEYDRPDLYLKEGDCKKVE